MNFLETERAKELLTAVLSEHLAHIKSDLTNTEIEVMNQRSRLFKSFCKIWYGHLYKKVKDQMICSRCGIIKKEKI